MGWVRAGQSNGAVQLQAYKDEQYRGADKSLARPGRKQATATEDFDVHISYLYLRNISTIYIYKTRLESNEIFSPSNKIHREVCRAKDLSAPTVHMCRGADKSLTLPEKKQATAAEDFVVHISYL
jgi:hypothetical protein